MQWLIFGIIGVAVALGIHRMSREGKGGDTFSRHPDKTALSAQEMTQCPVCQAYVVRHAMTCGREDCPYPSPGSAA